MASATFSSAKGAWKCTASEAFALKARAAAGRRKNQTLQRMGRMHTSERRDEVEITLSSRVQTLVEAQVKQAGYPNASALIEEAVLRLFEHGEAKVDLESSPREGIKSGPEEEVCPEPLRSDILQGKSQKPGSLLAFLGMNRRRSSFTSKV